MRRGRFRSAQIPAFDLGQALASLGAIADFDPAVGATDDGTTSTWTDRIGGYTVVSASQATRLVFSASLAGLNGRPGWTGVAASNTRLTQVSSPLAALLDDAAASTVYAVRKYASGNSVYFSAGGSVNGHALAWGVSTSAGGTTNLVRYDGDVASIEGTIGGTELRLDAIVYSGTEVSMWSNAVQTRAAIAMGENPICNTLGIGYRSGPADQSFDGLIGRIVVFNTSHNTQDREYVQTAIMQHYGIT